MRLGLHLGAVQFCAASDSPTPLCCIQELRVAQMEAMRAANLMSHHKDIMSRPARTWFQSVAEKAAVKQAVLDQLRKGSDATTAAPIPQKSRKQIKAELKAAVGWGARFCFSVVRGAVARLFRRALDRLGVVLCCAGSRPPPNRPSDHTA